MEQDVSALRVVVLPESVGVEQMLLSSSQQASELEWVHTKQVMYQSEVDSLLQEHERVKAELRDATTQLGDALRQNATLQQVAHMQSQMLVDTQQYLLSKDEALHADLQEYLDVSHVELQHKALSDGEGLLEVRMR